MIFHDIEQNTPEWDALRLGKFTASNFSDLFMGEKTKGYKDLIYRVAYERLTGEKADEGFTNKWTERGHLLEQEAREFYELETYNKVHNGGFVELSEWVGCSPDGLLSSSKGVEIKVPKFNTMIGYLLNKNLPDIYEYQVQGSMYVTGFKEWDFIAYNPKLKPLIITVKRDEEIIKEIGLKLSKAIKEAEQIISKLK
jgi:putative phage-type endonuclease